MRIAFCHHLTISYNAGGEQEIAQVATRLQGRGHQVSVYALPLAPQGRRLVAPSKILEGVSYQEGWRHRVDCDVAYVTYSPFCLVSFRINAPKVAGFHSEVWFRKPSLSYGAIPLLAKLAYDLTGRIELSRFDAIHVHDEYLKRTFAFLGKPIFPIEHPIDIGAFKPTGQKNVNFTVLFCGRPSWAKGFDIFVDLANDLKDVGIEFAWLGGDAQIPNVKSLGFAFDRGIVAATLSRSHVVVMPQRIDSIGRTVLEALAVGTPVLLQANPISVPRLPSLTIVQSKDEIKSWIIHYRDLWQSGKYRASYEAADVVAKKYSVEDVADRYEEMFESLA